MFSMAAMPDYDYDAARSSHHVGIGNVTPPTNDLYRTACEMPGHVSGAFKKMRDMPIRRNVELRSEHSKLNLQRPSNRDAVLAQAVGEEEPRACNHCMKEEGAFRTCVTVKDEWGLLLQGSCASCHVNSAGNRCSFRLRKAAQQTVEAAEPEAARLAAAAAAAAEKGKKRKVNKTGNGNPSTDLKRQRSNGHRDRDESQVEVLELSDDNDGDDNIAAPSPSNTIRARQSADLLRVAATMMDAARVNANATAEYLRTVKTSENPVTATTLATTQTMFGVACGSVTTALKDAANSMGYNLAEPARERRTGEGEEDMRFIPWPQNGRANNEPRCYTHTHDEYFAPESSSSGMDMASQQRQRPPPRCTGCGQVGHHYNGPRCPQNGGPAGMGSSQAHFCH